MELRGLIYGLILLGLTMGVFGLVTINLQESYNFSIDPESQNVYNRINETYSKTYDLTTSAQSKVQGKGVTFADSFSGLFNNGLAALQVMWGSIGIAETIAEQFLTLLGIPTIFMTALVAMLSIFLAFYIISAVFKWQL